MASSVAEKALQWSAFFIVWLLAAPVSADLCAMPATAQPVVSKYVIDGDTLELSDGRRVRLIGINTPEIGYRGRPSEPFARKARAELERLIAGADLRLAIGKQSKDRHGRTLGHLYADGVNVEAQLLRDGLGFAVGIAPNLVMLDCHIQQENLARQKRLGLWQQTPVKAAKAVKAGGFQVIRGQVVKVERVGRYIWLDLDGPVTLRLSSSDAERFGDVFNWPGLVLEVRGWLVERKSQRGHKRFMLPSPEPRLTLLE